MMRVSGEIRILREKFLMTQEDFAKEIGVSSSTVNRWEKGKARPNISAMKKIKKFCDDKQYPYEEVESAWITHC